MGTSKTLKEKKKKAQILLLHKYSLSDEIFDSL